MAVNDGATPLYLYIASENGHCRVVTLLLAAGCDANKAVNDGATLYIASENGHCQVVTLLLGGNCDVDKAVNNRATPLYIACAMEQGTDAGMLLRARALQPAGPVLLHRAASRAHLTVVDTLVSIHPDPPTWHIFLVGCRIYMPRIYIDRAMRLICTTKCLPPRLPGVHPVLPY